MPDSLWIATTPRTSYPRLDGDHAVDVAIAGGGIVGIVTGLLLKQAGKSVALLERGRIVEGVTGHTTAKLTAQHGLRYRQLGEDDARLYAEAQSAAIEWVASTGVDCDLRRMPAYVWAETEEELEQVREEVLAARVAGLPASFADDVPLLVAARGAVRFEDQAIFHPRKLLLELAEQLDGGRSAIFEHTPALGVDQGTPSRLRTPYGTVSAEHVLLATHVPFTDRGLHFARVFPYRGYAIAAEIEPETAPEGMFINASRPTRSVRPAADEDGAELVIVGGDGHRTGSERDTARHWQTLESWARERFPLGEVRYRWSTQDAFSADELPLVGPLHPLSRRTYAATGFGGWGMTGGIAAAHVLADLVLGRESPSAELFDPARLRPLTKPRLWQENLAAVRHLLGDRLRALPPEAIADLDAGDGIVVDHEGERLAVSKADDGTLTAVSALCTHLGCIVRWNRGEASWDCPCHGSRFGPDGSVLHGPAVDGLTRKPLPP